MRLVRLLIATALFIGFSSAAFAEDAAPAEEPGWKGNVSLGGSLSSGTISSYGGSIAATGEREFGQNLVRLGLLARYGTTDANTDDFVTTANEQVLTQYLRHTVSDRLYVYGETEESRDSVRRINLRLLATAGPGYKVWTEEADGAALEVEGGIGYRYEDYNDGNHAAMKANSRNDVTGRAAALFKDKVGAAEFGQSAEFLLPFNDTSAWLARAESRLAFPLLESWAFVNTLGLEYSNKPAPATKSFELDYVVSLEYTF